MLFLSPSMSSLPFGIIFLLLEKVPVLIVCSVACWVIRPLCLYLPLIYFCCHLSSLLWGFVWCLGLVPLLAPSPFLSGLSPSLEILPESPAWVLPFPSTPLQTTLTCANSVAFWTHSINFYHSLASWPCHAVCHHLYFIFWYLASHGFAQLDCASGAHRLWFILPSVCHFVWLSALHSAGIHQMSVWLDFLSTSHSVKDQVLKAGTPGSIQLMTSSWLPIRRGVCYWGVSADETLAQQVMLPPLMNGIQTPGWGKDSKCRRRADKGMEGRLLHC